MTAGAGESERVCETVVDKKEKEAAGEDLEILGLIFVPFTPI